MMKKFVLILSAGILSYVLIINFFWTSLGATDGTILGTLAWFLFLVIGFTIRSLFKNLHEIYLSESS